MDIHIWVQEKAFTNRRRNFVCFFSPSPFHFCTSSRHNNWYLPLYDDDGDIGCEFDAMGSRNVEKMVPRCGARRHLFSPKSWQEKPLYEAINGLSRQTIPFIWSPMLLLLSERCEILSLITPGQVLAQNSFRAGFRSPKNYTRTAIK